jgi:hypothetical protein
MSRRKYRWDDETQTLIEVPLDYRSVTRNIAAPVTDLYMDGTRTSDGIDISSRTKRREYMRVAGVADMSDFTDTWAKAEKQRETFYTGQHDKKARREAVERAAYQLERKRR